MTDERARGGDVATSDVLAFVTASVRPRARVLEIGAGDGRLAAALRGARHDVVAVDPEPRGPEVVRASFPDLRGAAVSAPFDAVLFTRSLHHIQPLEDALDRAAELLGPGGVLVVDDFGWEDVDAKTAAWAYKSLGWPCDGGPLAAWKRHHQVEHGVTEGRAIVAAVRGRFGEPAVTRVPYFWRYLRDHDASAAAAFRGMEARLAASKAIRLVGVRIVASAC